MVHCPPSPKPLFVDREIWEKIVLNLLSNALKFTLKGEITVTLRYLDKHTELSVRDTGCGIPAEELPKMFSRFHRIPNAQSRTYEDTGIGLALVQRLVQCHHGTIAVESSLNLGSVFTVRIPNDPKYFGEFSSQANSTQEAAALSSKPFVEEALNWLVGDEHIAEIHQGSGPSNHAPESHPIPSVSGRVLLVDDNADLRHYLQQLLSQRWSVQLASDGEEALQSAFSDPPDLILSDVMMPKMDGFQLLQHLRADSRTKDIPIILLSARAGEEARVEGIEKGADDYLVKPFSARELYARVQTHLNLAQQRREVARVLMIAKTQLEEVNKELEKRVAERTAELAAEKTMLERSNRELEEFAGAAAHDLRAPLRSMLNWTEMLDLMVPQPRSSEVNQAIDFILLNAKKAGTLINDVLEVARLNTASIVHQVVDLNKTLENILANHQPEITNNGANIHCTGLPTLWGHPNHLESVLNNLLDNALIYKNKLLKPEIFIGFSEESDFYQFFVKDNGIGIDAPYTEKIFEMFNRLHSEGYTSGSGIGLAYCKKVIELSGGRIWVNSELGVGSTFYFTYPKHKREV